MTMQIQVRRDTAANWTGANPTLAAGELGLETDTGRMKMGDGSTAWNTLGYMIIQEPVAGDIIYGDATPKWAKLAKGDNDEVLTLVAGLPSWAAGGGGVSESDLIFLDNFTDASRHWGWYDNAKNGSITEAAGLLTLSIADSVNGGIGGAQNNGPRCLMGDPGAPFEIKAKLNSYTVRDSTQAGICISSNSGNGNFNQWLMFGRTKKTDQALDGLAVTDAAGGWGASNAVTTLPIYLRFRITVLGDDESAEVECAYSLNDADWTVLQTVDLSTFTEGYKDNYVVGVFARNRVGSEAAEWTPLIEAPFEWFKMGRTLGPG